MWCVHDSSALFYADIYALLQLLFMRVGRPFVGYSDCFRLIIRREGVRVATGWLLAILVGAVLGIID